MSQQQFHELMAKIDPYNKGYVSYLDFLDRFEQRETEVCGWVIIEMFYAVQIVQFCMNWQTNLISDDIWLIGLTVVCKFISPRCLLVYPVNVSLFFNQYFFINISQVTVGL